MPAPPRYQREPQGQVEDRLSGMSAIVRQQQSLGELFGKFRDTAAEFAAPLIAEKAKKAGTAAGADKTKKPELRKNAVGVYGRTYNEAALAAHRASLSADLTTKLDQYEGDAGNDPAKFDVLATELRRELVERADESVRAELEQEFELQAGNRRNRVLDRGRKVALDEAEAELAQSTETFRGGALKAARNGDLDELLLEQERYRAVIAGARRTKDNPNGALDPVVADKMLRDLDTEVEVESVIGSFERLVGEGDLEKANARLDKLETGEDKALAELEPEQRDRALARMNAILARENADKARAKAIVDAERVAREKKLRDDWQDAKGALEAGFEVEGLDELVKASEGTDLELEVRKGAMMARQGAQFAKLSPVQQEAWLREREAELRKRKVKPVEAAQLQAFQKVHDRATQALAEDPMGYAVKQGIAPPLPPLDFGNPDALADAVAARSDAARVASAHYGRQVSPLTKQETTALGSALNNSPAAERAQLLGSLADAFGPRQFPDVMEQLHKQGYKTLAFIGSVGSDPQAGLDVAREALMGLDLVAADKKLVPSDEVLRPQLAQLRAGYADPEPVVDTVLALYARRSQVAGDSSGVLNTGRLQQAIQDVTGGMASWSSGGGLSVFPSPAPGVDTSKFKTWMKGLPPALFEDVAGLDGETARELTLSKGRLVGIGRGRFLVSLSSANDARGNRYLLKDDGEPFVLRWYDAP